MRCRGFVPGTLQGDFETILRALADQRVDFIVVGGVAAVLEGAPVNTFDLDVVHSREPGNISRLLAALELLNATYRIQPERKLRPDASHLASPGHQLLTTSFGPLDMLGSIGRSRDYSDLLPHTIELEVGDDLRVRVLNLATLVTVKEETAGEKDVAMLPILRRTLEEKQKR
jgi:hypothetical protein